MVFQTSGKVRVEGGDVRWTRSAVSRRTERLASIAWGSEARRVEHETAAYKSLVARYSQLTEKYAQAVDRGRRLTEKYTQVVHARINGHEGSSSQLILATWALQMSSWGFALVEGDRICLTNAAFVALDREEASDEEWQQVAGAEEPVGGNESAHYPHLRTLAVGEAAALQRIGQKTIWKKFSRGAQILDVSVEQSDRRGRALTLVIVRDDTDLTRALASVAAMKAVFARQDKVRALGELAIGIAHDLNNVLGSLTMSFDLLQRDPVVRASQAKNLERMERIVRSCTSRVRSLHSFIKGQAGSSTFDMSEVVASAVQIAQAGFATNGGPKIHVHAEVPALPRVRGAADEVCHVLINLLVNARDAMTQGGTVTIRAVDMGESVRVAVEDEGPGIPSEHLGLIFDPFFTTKGANGTGVGLSTAKEILEKFGGSISAQNVASGGARFELAFQPST